MYALAAMALALAVLVILLRLEFKLGLAMMLSSLALAILLRVGPGQFWQSIVNEWHNKPLGQTTGFLFVTLTVLLTFVNVLGEAMNQTGVSKRLVPAVQGLFRSRRVAMAAIPLLMGMLPTPGGIMLSAPMVRQMADHIGVDRTRSAAINFFFRHLWEPAWPLFPAVPLIQTMFGISAFVLIWHNLAITLGGMLGGVIFLLMPAIPPKKQHERSQERFTRNLWGFLAAFWPIAVVAGLYAGLNITPAIGILLATVLFLIFHRVRPARWPGIFRAALVPDFALLVLGALLFKVNLEAANAVDDVVEFFSTINVPPYVLIFLLPAMVSFFTGVTMPTVAITFPFLTPYIGTGAEARIGLEVLAFSGLCCGVLATPVHLCLALSASYFEAPLIRIVLKLAGPLICIAAAGFLMAWLFK